MLAEQVNKFIEESDEIEIEREDLGDRPRVRDTRTISSDTEAGTQSTDNVQRVPSDVGVSSQQNETDSESRGTTRGTESSVDRSTDMGGSESDGQRVREQTTSRDADEGSGVVDGDRADETTDRGSVVGQTIPQGVEEDVVSGLDADELLDVLNALNEVVEEESKEVQDSINDNLSDIFTEEKTESETKGSLPNEDVAETETEEKPVEVESVEEQNDKKKAEIIKGQESESGLQVQYKPLSNSESFQTSMPIYLFDAYKNALKNMLEDLGIDNVDTYVKDKLNVSSKKNLYQMLGAEQIESVALMIYNLEQKGLASVIGDQTGVGKGRQMMAMHRWALLNGKVPVYLTAFDTLFPQAYVDDAKGLRMYGVKDREFKPFLVVSPKKGNNQFKDGDDVVFQGLSKPLQDKLMKGYDGKNSKGIRI